MKTKKRNVPFKVKAIDTAGQFSGYLSVFGNTDQYRDVVMPGAFTDTLKAWASDDALPPILWQHNSAQPLGPFTKMVQDDHGLYVEGQLLVDDVQQAREAHALLKSGAMRGMSIGYSVDDDEFDGKLNLNKLKAVTLWEGSIVTFPANVLANVDEVKSIIQAGELPTATEFEDLLRDVAGLSRTQAKTVVSHGYGKLLSLRDAEAKQVDPDSSGIDSLLALITNFASPL